MEELKLEFFIDIAVSNLTGLFFKALFAIKDLGGDHLCFLITGECFSIFSRMCYFLESPRVMNLKMYKLKILKYLNSIQDLASCS